MREPGYYEFRARQGRTWNPVLTWKDDAGTPIDLTGWNVRMQVREHVEDTELVEELTVGDGIVLGGVAGTIALMLTDTETAAMAADRYLYSLEVISPGGVKDDLLEGPFTVVPEVTR